MSDATAPSPMRSFLLAILMITSTMTAALTTPWLVEDVRGDATYDGSDASDNSSQPSQVTSFNMQLNGTLDSSDSSDWYYVELFSGDTVDFEASCTYSNCGTMMSFEPGNQGYMSYSLTTNSSDVNYSFTNYGSTTYNLTFGFENWALQNVSNYLFTIDMTPSNNTGGGGNNSNGTSVYGDLAISEWNGQQVTGSPPSNFSAGNHSLAWEVYNLSNTGTYRIQVEMRFDDNSFNLISWVNHSLNTNQSYNTIPFTLLILDQYCEVIVNGRLYWEDSGNSTLLDTARLRSDGPCGTNGTSHNDLGYSNYDVSATWMSNGTFYRSPFNATVGGNDFQDVYYVHNHAGKEIEIDANCADQNGCSIMLMVTTVNFLVSTSASGQFQLNYTLYDTTYYNLTSNNSDSVYIHSNLTSHESIFLTFASMNAPPWEGYQFNIQQRNSNASSNGTGGNGTGGNGSHNPEIYVWTDSYSYNTGDIVEVTIEAVHLNNEDVYNVHWSLYDEDGNWENSSSFNISNSEWYEDYFMIWDLSTDGCYELHVNLSDDNLMHLDSDSYEFEIGPGLCGSQSDHPWIDVWTDYDFDSGDNVSVDYAIGDLTMNHSYFIEWELRDKENWNSIDSGEESLGTPNVLYWESDIEIGSLGDGCYLFEANLYVVEDGTGIWLDHSDTEFGVGADADCNPLDIWIDGKDFDSGDNASFAIFVDNMMNMSEHTIRVELHKHHFGLDSTSQWNFTAYGESTELYWDFGPLEDGCYDIQVAVASDDGDFARSGHGFSVGDVNCAHPWIELHSDRTTFTSGNDVWFDMTFYDFPVNQTVDMDYELWSDYIEYADFGMFSVNITSWNESYTYNLGTLPDGCYEISLTDVAGEMDHHLTAHFVVGSSTDEEGNHFACWDPSIHIESVDHRHDYSDTEEVEVVIKIDGLHDSIGYYVYWEVLDDESSQHENGSYFPASGVSSTIPLSLGPFAADGRCLELNVFLYEEGESWDIAYSDWRFEIGNADCWPPQLEVWAHGSEDWDGNEIVQTYLEMDIRAWDLDEGQEYNILWSVYDEDDTLVDDGEVNEFSWNHDLSYRYELYNLSEGCYNVEVYLYDNEWNLLSDDKEEKIGLGEVNCWAEPGIDFNYDDSRGQLQYHVWDLRHNDHYRIFYRIYELDSSGNLSHLPPRGGSFGFMYDDYDWNGINTFVSLDEGEYWVEVTLSKAPGGEGDELSNSSGYIDVGDNSEEVWLRLHEDNLFATGAQIEFEVGVGNLDDETDYLLEVKLVKHTRDSRNIIDEYSVSEGLTNGYHIIEFNSPTDGTYDLEVQLFDSETDEFLSSDGNMICVGDGCPTGENINGEAKLKLTVNWPDRPGSEENNTGDCQWVEVKLIPEQRWLDYEDGNAIYGAYPDWKEQDWFDDGESFTQFEFEFHALPVGDYYVHVRVDCSGEIDGEWRDYQGFTDVNDDTWAPTSFTGVDVDEGLWNWTYHTVELKTDDHDHHDDGDDDGLSDFVEPYLNSSSVSYRVTVKQGPDGPELHVEMGIPLNTDIIADIDQEMGDGDGLISQEEMDLLIMMMMEGDEFEWDDEGSGFYWDGMEFGANEFQVDGERIWGLVEGEPYYAEFVIFSIPITGTPAGTFGLFPSEQEGQPICEDGDMPEDWSVVIDVFGADGWTITDAPVSFTADEMGHHKLSLDCEDVFPGTLDFDMEYDENGSGTDPGTDPEPVTNTPPVCVIEWYRDGDNLSADGMKIFSASDGVESIQVSAGDTFSVYFECSDADGDEMNLKITPPFGSEVNYSAEGSVNRFVQLTIPSGTQGNFDFSAEWSDAASGGEYEFQVSITAPEDGEETEEDSTSAASFVPGFSAVLSFTAVLGAVILLALRRDEEE